MQRRICHIVAICLTVLLVMGRTHVAYALHDAQVSGPQLHTCDNSSSAPLHETKDCADACPFCQASLKDAALVAVYLEAVLVDRPIVSMPRASAGFVVTPINLIVNGHRVRAPPRLHFFG